ncbi:MAG: hypothetical protein OXU79_08845 [Gemmatimonadota bacterium]|nr:hypothetical protein [Gemmatimonadota bacterium]
MIAAFLILLTFLVGVSDARAQTGDVSRFEKLYRGARLRYNRVEGPFLGYRLSASRKDWPRIKAFAEGGYGFASRAARWEAGVEYRSRKISFNAAVFDRSETPERGIVGTTENSLLSLLFKWDYRDYFRAKNGFEAKFSLRSKRTLSLFIGLTAYGCEPLPVRTAWSVFFRNRPFRNNPPARPGDVGLLHAGVTVDTRVGSPLFRNAWFGSLRYERGFREFPFHGLTLEGKRYQKARFGRQGLIVRARLNTRQSAATQFLFGLGGAGTLRGYDIKEFRANRLVLVNVEYAFRGDVLPRIPVSGFHLLNLTVFADAGWTRLMPESARLFAGFGEPDLASFRTSTGLGIALPRQLLRLNVARRLDRSDDAWSLYFRLRYDL